MMSLSTNWFEGNVDYILAYEVGFTVRFVALVRKSEKKVQKEFISKTMNFNILVQGYYFLLLFLIFQSFFH